MSQPTFAALAFANKKKKTRREEFLEEMDQVVPWPQLLKVMQALSESRQRATTAGFGEDVAHLFFAAMVQSV